MKVSGSELCTRFGKNQPSQSLEHSISVMKLMLLKGRPFIVQQIVTEHSLHGINYAGPKDT